MSTSRKVKTLLTSQQHIEGGGFKVRRPVGNPDCDPFLLLDHFGPVDYRPGEAVGAPDHPHRGFETVSYIVDGTMKHRDSAGNSGELRAGWVQWMTAGSGVVHAEMPGDELMKNGGRMEGFQLWVNLSAKDKKLPPRYQDTPSEAIPVVTAQEGKVWIKVIAGEALGTRATIETRSPILYLDVRLKPGTVFVQAVPEEFGGFVYVWRGSGYLGSERTSAQMGQVGFLDHGDEVRLEASELQELRILLVAGKPLREPIARHGPFVMNTREEIEQAFKDYHAGRMGSIEGEEERYRATQAAKKQQMKNIQ